MPDLPRYSELPITPDAPPCSAWGVFGPNDQLGTLNHLTPERRAAAAALARAGRTFNLDLPLDHPVRPFLRTRNAPTHMMTSRPNANTRDEYLDGFFPQFSSQWDGLRHVRHPEHGFYNGTTDEEVVAGSGRLGMENFARHGIVGRGVLLDAERFLRSRGEPIRPDERYGIPARILDEVAATQDVELLDGDILMLRTGVGAMIAEDARHGLTTPRYGFQSPGLESEEASLEWLWDKRVAAIVSDNAAVEVWPPSTPEDFLHYGAIALLGLVFGELFDLEALAADCASDGVYECLFVAKPWMLRGGVGSPANAMAIK